MFNVVVRRLVGSSSNVNVKINVFSTFKLPKSCTTKRSSGICYSQVNKCFCTVVPQQNLKVKLTGKGIQDNISALKTKKRHLREKKPVMTEQEQQLSNTWAVKAMATADEYNLDALIDGLRRQNLYEPKKIVSSDKGSLGVVHAVAKYEVGHEPREIYYFREGTVVMWNISDLECENVVNFLKQFEESSYPKNLVQLEKEVMIYGYADKKKSYLAEGKIVLAPEANALDKYTFANAMSQSVKLAIWEASLNNYVDSVEFVLEDLKAGRRIDMTRQAVLRKQGELFALRHLINLSSDLLDTPDFYWERDDLEKLFHQTCGYFSIAKRTRVMNEKLNHCTELVELLSSHLSDRHHVRLEWMIIVLIMVEVAFETLHYVERYYQKDSIAHLL